MNVLLFRDIAEAELAVLTSEFPQCIFRRTTNAEMPGRDADWPQIIFGNVPAPALKGCRNLRWLQIVSAGFDEYLSLADTGVTVTTAHGIRAPIIAQHVLMTILAFVRKQSHFQDCQRKKIWDRRPEIPQPVESQTVGILGYGEVGSELARLARPLRMRLVATKRSGGPVPPELDELFPRERLDELIAASDHLVVALPFTEETRGILDRRRIGLLKPGAVIHNIARGGLLDEKALIERLRDGSLGGAALDVFEEEPLPATSPLWDLPNVIITPHLAGHHSGAAQLILEQFKTNLRHCLRQEPLEHVADFSRGY